MNAKNAKWDNLLVVVREHARRIRRVHCLLPRPTGNLLYLNAFVCVHVRKNALSRVNDRQLQESKPVPGGDDVVQSHRARHHRPTGETAGEGGRVLGMVPSVQSFIGCRRHGDAPTPAAVPGGTCRFRCAAVAPPAPGCAAGTPGRSARAGH